MTSIYDGLPGSAPSPDEQSSTPAKRTKKRERLSSSELRSGKVRMYEMVERAFQTLEDAMTEADYPTAVKAALGILDRTGFGPQSKLDVTTTNINLAELTKEELAERARRVADLLAARGRKADSGTVIDVTAIQVQ